MTVTLDPPHPTEPALVGDDVGHDLGRPPTRRRRRRRAGLVHALDDVRRRQRPVGSEQDPDHRAPEIDAVQEGEFRVHTAMTDAEARRAEP